MLLLHRLTQSGKDHTLLCVVMPVLPVVGRYLFVRLGGYGCDADSSDMKKSTHTRSCVAGTGLFTFLS